MSIFDTLTREHGVMLGLTARVERAFRGGRDDGEGRRCLLVLHHALNLHEEIEDLLIGPADQDASPELARALSRIALQHAEIVSLRNETRELLGRAGRRDESAPRLIILSLMLARRLRAHFQSEELLLWPLLAGCGGRSVGRSLARRAEKGVADLQKCVHELERAAVEYL